jgi:hypothetical protein
MDPMRLRTEAAPDSAPRNVAFAGAGPSDAVEAESILRPVDMISILYLIVSGILAAWFLYPAATGGLVALAHGAVILALPFCLRALGGEGRGWKNFLREWYPAAFFFTLYAETALINPGSPVPSLDPWLSGIDDAVFGAQLSEVFPEALPMTWFQEWMAFSYCSYYMLIPGGGLYIWLKDRRAFSGFLFTTAACFYFCYIVFIVFPAGGPQMYLRGGVIHWDGVFFGPLLTAMLGTLESDTGAFPSSHIAISLIVVVSVWRQKGALRYLFALVFVGLFLATVYGGPHYAVDLPAGVAVGIFFLFAGARLKRALT